MGTWSPNRAQGTSSRMIGKMMVTLALLFALSEAASITYPARNQLDINFNNFGFKFGAKFDNKVRPQDGGKVHMEVPANMVMRIIRGEPSIARQLLVPFKEEMYLVYSPSFLERLYDVVNIKMEIDYKTKQAKLGVMSVTAKYIITHHDYTEETGTLMLEGDGQNVVFQTLPSEEMFTKTVFRPMEIKLTKMQKEIKMFFTQEMTKFETTFVQRGQVFEANMMMDPEDEHKRQMMLRVDVGNKKITFTRSEDDVEKMNLVLDVEGDMMSNVVKFTGKLQETRWWKEGTPVEFIFKMNGDNVDATFSFNNFKFAKMNFARVGGSWKLRGNAYLRGLVSVVVDSATGEFDVTLPKEWFYDNMNLQVQAKTNNCQDYTLNLKRDNIVFYTVLVGKQMTRTNIKADVTLETKDTEMVDSFLELVGVSKYRLCQTLVSGCFTKAKYSLEASAGKFYVMVEKENKKVLEFDLVGTRTTAEMNFFYPKFFMRMLNKPFEKLIVKVEAGGDNYRLKTNYEDIKAEFRCAPENMMATFTKNSENFAVFNMDYDFEWSHWTVESQLELHEDSYTHKMLCDFSTHMCFKNLDYKLNFQPAKFLFNEQFTKDGKNVWQMEANFNQRPFVAKLNTPYLVPFYKYMTTPRSFFSTFMNPLPVLLSPFEVTLNVDQSLSLTSNIDMHKSSVEIVPAYNNQYKMTFKRDGIEVTKALEFTMTDNMIEYGQFKIWKEGNFETVTFQYMTDFDVPQTLTMTRNSNFVKMNFDVRGNKEVRNGAFHVNQDVSFYMPFATRKGFNFFFGWKGEAELPYVKMVSNEGFMGVGADRTSNKVFKINSSVNNHGIVFTLNRDGLKYDYDFEYE